MKTRILTLSLLLTSIAVLMSSCCSYDYYFERNDSIPTTLQGKIMDGKYRAGNELFIMDMPPPAENGYTIDMSETGLASVAFFNKLGYHLNVMVVEIREELSSILEHCPEVKPIELNRTFWQMVYTELKDLDPNVNILSKEIIYLDNDNPALFAVVELPVYEVNDHQNPKVTYYYQGILLTFVENKFIVEIRRQDMFCIRSGSNHPKSSNLMDWWLQSILRETKSLQCTREIKVKSNK